MDRFWSKVDVRGPDECWLWIAGQDGRGYGNFYVEGRSVKAHRFAFKLHHDQPVGTAICHTCDNPLCVNPAHLYDGSRRDNVQDAVDRGQHPRGERHGRSKLTAEIVLEMRRRHAAGESYAALAREFGVFDSVARKAILGITWKSV